MNESDYIRAPAQFASSLKTLVGGSDKKKKRSRAEMSRLISTIDPEDAAGVHQFNSYRDFLTARKSGYMRGKDIRRLEGTFKKRRAAYEERMVRHQERMRGMETTRMSVAARAV